MSDFRAVQPRRVSDPHSSPSTQSRPRSAPDKPATCFTGALTLDHRTLVNFAKLPILDGLMRLSPAQHARKGTAHLRRPGRSISAPIDMSENDRLSALARSACPTRPAATYPNRASLA